MAAGVSREYLGGGGLVGLVPASRSPRRSRSILSSSERKYEVGLFGLCSCLGRFGKTQYDIQGMKVIMAKMTMAPMAIICLAAGCMMRSCSKSVGGVRPNCANREERQGRHVTLCHF